ncbi:unnamed protein product [Eruca vesicaria subsp. sativa]|uniref:F-box domain-containing protein n=1 Tax=Eruca vesicaria subsp. sativa TaxID=29727 RepID=A0ABC8LBW0_ERUVS|nr:unnamed protein product [Eruca vesicaria subsp. sativa]
MKPRRQNTVSGERLTTTTRRLNRRPKTSDNKTESSALPIPTDVVIEIFSRLPLKSVATCRCVWKLWSSVLRRPDFTDLFLTKSSSRPKIVFNRRKDGKLLFFSSPQLQNPDENSSVAAHPLMNFTDFNFGSFYKLSGPFRGLVCLLNKQISESKTDIVPMIGSPSTGQTLILPKVKTTRGRVKCLLGYDPVDKQFKVLSMTQPLNGRKSWDYIMSEHQVLTLGTGKLSWRMIQCCVPHIYPRESICINGVLYYSSLLRSDAKIVSFDVRSEKFRVIEVKGSLKRALFGDMINYNGKLGLVISEYSDGSFGLIFAQSSGFRLWVLEDVEKQEWSQHFYVLPASWKNVAGEHTFEFVGLARTTNEIVLSSLCPPYCSYLIYFNPERNTLVRVEIQGLEMGVSAHQTFLDHVEDVSSIQRLLKVT